MRRKKLLKRGVAIFIVSAMMLSGCNSNNNASPASSLKDTDTENVGNTPDSLEGKALENDTNTSTKDKKVPENNSKAADNDANTSENDSESTENNAKISEKEKNSLEDNTNKSNMDNTTEVQDAEPQSENIAETSKDSEIDATSDDSEISDLFKDIYLPYANREKPFAFVAVKEFAQNANSYDVEIQDPTAENIGTITFKDTNGDSVFFAFATNESGIDVIMTLSYHQAATDSEVSLSNYSSDCAPQHDIFDTHIIGEQEIEVNGPDEQQDFLFKN